MKRLIGTGFTIFLAILRFVSGSYRLCLVRQERRRLSYPSPRLDAVRCDVHTFAADQILIPMTGIGMAVLCV